MQKDFDVLNAQDNLFQLAFRKEPIWSHVKRILTMWETGEAKGQKSKVVKQNRKAKDVGIFESAPLVEDIKLTNWQLMQSLKDPNVVILVLQEVTLKKFSLQEMRQEFKKLKYQAIAQQAFLASLIKPIWKECKETYTEHCTNVILNNFMPFFHDLGKFIR